MTTQLELAVARAATIASSIEARDPAHRMGRALRRAARTGPLNSIGQPWAGETWRCTACGATGPDRDDARSGEPGGLPFPGCPSGHASGRGPCALIYSPPEHHRAIERARLARKERA